MSEKKLQEMTEEQILDEVLKAVPEYLERIKPDGAFNRQICVEEVVKNLRKLFKASRGIGYYDRMMVRDIRELDTLIGHFMPLITERVSAAERQYKKEQMVTAINVAKAEAIIVPAFESAGFEFKVSYFKYTASIRVRLFGNKWASFQIRYKNITGAGCLDDLVSAVVDLRDAAKRIGGNLYIRRQ